MSNFWLGVAATCGAFILFACWDTYWSRAHFITVLDRWDEGVRGSALFDGVPDSIVDTICITEENDSAEMKAIAVHARAFVASRALDDA